jgi:hypothetical protein
MTSTETTNMSGIWRKVSVHLSTGNRVLGIEYELEHEECNSKMHLMMQIFQDVMLCHSAQVVPDILKALQSFKISGTSQQHTKSLSSIGWNYYINASQYLLWSGQCSITVDVLQQHNTSTQSNRLQSTSTCKLHKPWLCQRNLMYTPSQTIYFYKIKGA